MVLHYLVNRSGVAVLVYVNGTEPALYSLSIKTSDTQATISLQCSLRVRGFDDGEQTFIIEYGADNLVSGTTIIDTAGSEHELPSKGHLDRISRTGSIDNLKFLCLKIGKCCSIWCPPSSGSIGPKHDSDAAFAHLQQLAKSTVVHVLFDYSWIHVNKQKMLQDLFDEQKRKMWSTLPFRASFELIHRKADWTVFSPVDPPPYSGHCHKRPRSSNTSSPLPEARSQKRVHSFLDHAGSPTEIATTASSPAPRSPPRVTDKPSAPSSLAPRSPRIIDNPFAPKNIKDIVKDAVNAATNGRLEDFYNEVTQNVEARCQEAGLELQETLDDHRLDILTIKEDELADFSRVVDEALVEYKDTINAFKEDAELDIGYDTASCEGRHSLGRGRQSLQEKRKLIEEEEKLLDKESGLFDEEQQHIDHQRQHLENKRRHLEKHRLLLERKRQLLEQDQSCTTSSQ